MDRHGHKKHRTDPQTEINYGTHLKAGNALNGRDDLTSAGEAVERQQSVDATQIQKDVRSNPGSEIEIENVFKIDSTKIAQDKPRDGTIMPKPGLRQNKLVAKYGTNFRYLGIVKNGIDRVTVVTSILIPRYENVKIRPINFAKCAQCLDDVKGHSKTADTQASKAAKEWCAQAIPYMEYLKQQEKYYIEKVHELLCDDLYSALPELKLVPGPLRKRRGLGALILSAIPGLITLAVESVSSWIKGKQQKRVDEAVSAIIAESQVKRNKLRQYSNDFLMYGKYNVDTWQNVIDTVNAMHR